MNIEYRLASSREPGRAHQKQEKRGGSDVNSTLDDYFPRASATGWEWNINGPPAFARAQALEVETMWS